MIVGIYYHHLNLITASPWRLQCVVYGFNLFRFQSSFQVSFESGNRNWKPKLIPAWSHTFSCAFRRLPDSTLSSHWLMLMLSFVLIDRYEYFGFSLPGFRVGLSTINSKLLYLKLIVSAMYSLSMLKKKRIIESLTNYSIIYTHFSYFLLFLIFYRGW